MFENKNNVYLNRFSQFFICALPFLLIFYRGIADATLILIVLLFLLKSFKEGNWSWAKEQWFVFAIIFWLYLILINAPISINPEKSLFYAIAFIRWPIFAIALSYWIFNNQKNRKIFLVSFSIAFGFIIFDT
ncbi:MAG: hypothetical protein AAEA78_03300, partial [Methylophilaceae bacterium]